ncbi:MAG: hypothetical protein A2Y49_00005 [Candidatus Zambryskibacteria bacterium RIFCSPLOWO2_12_39_8]|uniref:GP-PDE domain-containing protein n=1 Tax=Candidatus Zambryskibacteria bacterium RIFCSPLOWO2_12_39_8 TaxID=1802774 RepID=A0A1G2UUH7_9BACT|nr:MAG: hypothetical protein A2Y49_00005 [Candidatus Zambryskibacteria bacterium RIFCSPLOWO2_12_39_8]
MYILTHRGLDPAKKPYFPESSREAFEDQLGRGFGLEFDLQFTKDGQMIVSHDPVMDLSNSHLISLSDLLSLIMKSGAELSALHLKHTWQKTEYLDKLLVELQKVDTERFIIFDVKIETAKYLKERNPKLHLASSVSHQYDIERYNGVVGGTLITIEEAIENKDLFDWVWLDEWDLTDKDGGVKSLYNKENFELLRKNNLKIALVTPELHATSPGLLGGESHQDAKDHQTLVKRLHEIITLKPDAICTDWPDLVTSL